MFIVKREFADIHDKGHVYREGDTYPRAGVKENPARIRELLSNSNRLGVSLIKEAEIIEKVKKAEEAEIIEKVKKAEEKKKTPKKTQKKAK